MSKTVTPAELVACGARESDAPELAQAINAVLSRPARQAWAAITSEILRPDQPFVLHQMLYGVAFAGWDIDTWPVPVWSPNPEAAAATNVGRIMQERGFNLVAQLHSWSVHNREQFWESMIERLGIVLAEPYRQVVDSSRGSSRARWLVGAKLNIANSCFGAPPHKPAIVYHAEEGEPRTVSYGELDALSNQVANGLVRAGFVAGDAVAIDLPMNVEAVAAYLGIIKSGCVAVSIADSLAADEIALRLRLSEAKAIVTQDVVHRGGQRLPLYEKVVAAKAPRAVVIVAGEAPQLREGDITWEAFLHDDQQFDAVLCEPNAHTNILFSSGTTGDPKAIPWNHTTPIKCAVDAHLHQDVQPDDCVAWPTNLGWMMGPWLIYGSLINRATMALYGGAPTGRDFGQFVQDARVTMLGVIPSLIKTWRNARCMNELDWSAVTRFSSTGECSNPDDMLFLMSLAGYKPVIEYCGGTELGGGYIGSTMAEDNVLSAFSTPSFGTEILFAHDDGTAKDANEVFLVPPSIGMSTELLHHDHQKVYYHATPRGPRGEVLRRHGDALVRLPGNYYRALGRTDDTMNLGGIKVSSAEIERVASVAGIAEVAAVAVPPAGGGPSSLWLFVVLEPDCKQPADALQATVQDAIRKHLNPLFKVQELISVDELPRTPTHKIMRRKLRDQAAKISTERMAILRYQAG